MSTTHRHSAYNRLPETIAQTEHAIETMQDTIARGRAMISRVHRFCATVDAFIRVRP